MALRVRLGGDESTRHRFLWARLRIGIYRAVTKGSGTTYGL
jgi:hypothetical protein